MATKTTKAAAAPTAKATPATAAPAPAAADDEAEDAVAVQLRNKEFLERVALATDLNKNKVREIVDATLNELGKALEAGEGVNLSGLGKIRIVNSRNEENGAIMTLKLRRMQPKPGESTAKETLAEAD